MLLKKSFESAFNQQISEPVLLEINDDNYQQLESKNLKLGPILSSRELKCHLKKKIY